jgi:hypothetical protein
LPLDHAPARAAQQAWLSVDLVHEGDSENDAYRFVGKTLAELAPPTAGEWR